MKYTFFDWLFDRRVKVVRGKDYKRVLMLWSGGEYVWLLDEQKEHEKSCLADYEDHVKRAFKGKL